MYLLFLGICTLIRAGTGVLLGPGRLITPLTLSRYLQLLDGQGL